jgi:mRNA-degrading endonuclease RelE of RelBE toxin-antitoxin system
LKVYETRKFKRLRERLRSDIEKEGLKNAIIEVAKDPLACKKLKGEFLELRRYKYTVNGQERRLIFKIERDVMYLVSFGPREGIYKGKL